MDNTIAQSKYHEFQKELKKKDMLAGKNFRVVWVNTDKPQGLSLQGSTQKVIHPMQGC
jgi:hypothetical protein